MRWSTIYSTPDDRTDQRLRRYQMTISDGPVKKIILSLSNINSRNLSSSRELRHRHRHRTPSARASPCRSRIGWCEETYAPPCGSAGPAATREFSGIEQAIAASEHRASREQDPERAFPDELGRQVLGETGLRNRYLSQADAGRGIAELSAPLVSHEQHSLIETGRFSGDRENGEGDGDPSFKTR